MAWSRGHPVEDYVTLAANQAKAGSRIRKAMPDLLRLALRGLEAERLVEALVWALTEGIDEFMETAEGAELISARTALASWDALLKEEEANA